MSDTTETHPAVEHEGADHTDASVSSGHSSAPDQDSCFQFVIEDYSLGGTAPLATSDKIGPAGEYRIFWKLGWGTTASVWLARKMDGRDFNDPTAFRAIKVCKASRTTHVDIVSEVEFLQRIRSGDQSHPGFNHVVTFYEQFQHETIFGKHFCMAFGVFGQHLQPKTICEYPIGVRKRLFREILLGVAYLHDGCGIVHTDLKHDNILIRIPSALLVPLLYNLAIYRTAPQALATLEVPDPIGAYHVLAPEPIVVPQDLQSLSVAIADFSTAVWARDCPQRGVIQPLLLRAPEVILRAPWSAPVDIWSLGCVFYELYTGEVLHYARLDSEDYSAEIFLLEDMQASVGPFPASTFTSVSYYDLFFNDEGALQYALAGETRGSLAERLQIAVPQQSAAERDSFVSLIRPMLQLDPAQRPSAASLSSHEWFSDAE